MTGRDTKLIRFLVFVFPILRLAFRIEFRGLEKIPLHPAVLVSNHNIGAVIEVLALLYAWEKRFDFKYSRPAYGLGHRFSFRIPLMSTFVRKLGSVPADYSSAKKVLEEGASLIIFPGGNWGGGQKFFGEMDLELWGRKGWIKIANASGVPIVPIAIAGSHAVNPVLLRSALLAKVFLMKTFFGVTHLPVSIGQILWSSLFVVVLYGSQPLWLALLGSFVIFCVTPLIPIWPARITIQFCESIDSSLPEPEIYLRTERAINEHIQAVKEGRSIFLAT